MKGRIIIIEGIQGSGKTVLCKSIEKWMGAEILEEWVDDDYLAEYIADMKVMAKDFQFRAQHETMKSILAAIEMAKLGKTVLLDRGIYGNHCFAQVQHELGFISKSEMKEYETLFKYDKVFTNVNGLNSQYTVETWLLECEAEVAMKRIAKRDRKGENGYTLDYLKSLQEHHREIVKADKVIDTNESQKLTYDGCLPENVSSFANFVHVAN